MTSSTMLEKIARSIASEMQIQSWQSCVPAARAAVLVMREPSSDMLEAALPDFPDYGFLPEEWRAMMKYILDEFPSDMPAAPSIDEDDEPAW